MQYIELREQLKDFKIFNLSDIRKIEADFDLRRLNEWQKKNYIKKIRQGFYIFSDLEISEQILFLIANRIHGPSYISLEMALSLHGLIPEAVYGITSVTTQKTKTLKTSIGDFIYRHIRPELMFGYELLEHEGHRYKMAEMEKSVLDYLYFNSKINNDESFAGLRFNAAEFKEKADMEKLNKYLLAFDNEALTRRVKKFLVYIQHA
ncbi:MAG: hypothetical protein A2734_02730 [Parcubacteria group bacterium RIFCSPHIGHO2_01_FULL_40_30]|nr:MAG: hypothetical protein A2734_02730 [Parcubacteria group bacterium RIFCSPHIGHO2_01_FULL_40_30]